MDTDDFLNKAYKHFKLIGILSKGQPFVDESDVEMQAGVLSTKENDFAQQSIDAVTEYRPPLGSLN